MNRRDVRGAAAVLVLAGALLGALGSATDPMPTYTPPKVSTTTPGSGGTYTTPSAPAVSQGKLGLALNNLSPQDQAFFKRQTGAVVEAVSPASLAERVGFRRNDLIIAIDHQIISGAADVVNAVNQVEAGKTLSFRLIRSGTEQQLSVAF